MRRVKRITWDLLGLSVPGRQAPHCNAQGSSWPVAPWYRKPGPASAPPAHRVARARRRTARRHLVIAAGDAVVAVEAEHVQHVRADRGRAHGPELARGRIAARDLAA